MKKILKVSIFLIISALFFAGCNNGSSSSGGGDEELPGNWSSQTKYLSFSKGPFKGSSLTRTNNKYVYTLEKPKDIDDKDKPSKGFNYTMYPITEENFIGFKATASSTSADTGYGFIFSGSIDSDKKWSYYTLLLNRGDFKLRQTIKDDTTDLTEWKSDTAINNEPDENEVVVYTDDDSSIIIQINGSTVSTIRSPVLPLGFCGIICSVAVEDVKNNTPIVQTYEFEEFQY